MSVLAEDLRSSNAKGGREQRNRNLPNLERVTPPKCLFKPSSVEETMRLLPKATHCETCYDLADGKVFEQKTMGKLGVSRSPPA